MKTYKEFLAESLVPGVLKDKEGSLQFGLTTNDDGVYFQIGNERFQSSKSTKDAILKIMKGDGKWQGGGAAGGKQAGISINRKEKLAYFKIGDESFILSNRAYSDFLKMFK
ncbi:hypothetical protein [Kosakonia phage Kc304]|uniref:Uncharacterized protein n=2 Tax=Winklervirus chi14 TaxID=2560752 RepID=A0A1Z1LYG0_9CAUD|nr:hypothetical protein FDI23_gp266 [Serratia phage CHI14]ARW57847.1 hypothetical protein [Serratia phage CBH8]QYN80592.1 hypothetical protein [Kosakonia phage Kc304]UJJ22139.1 hypothetical protein [Erwinia phage Virsaitis27]UYM28799.1 hypothetical protein [Serratia phage vB_SspM_LC53]ARW57572.1 hypothetical protein [Serratia phage CHI14]